MKTEFVANMSHQTRVVRKACEDGEFWPSGEPVHNMTAKRTVINEHELQAESGGRKDTGTVPA